MEKLLVHTKSTIEILNCDDIIRFQALGSYCVIKTTKEELTVSKNLASYSDQSLGDVFFRCHRSHLVNFNYVIRFHKTNQKLELSNGDLVPVAENALAKLMHCFQQLQEDSDR